MKTEVGSIWRIGITLCTARVIVHIMLNTAVPDVSVCGSEERSTFNKNLVKILRTEYNRMTSAAATGKHCIIKIM
jgi:hypothetical protein